MNKGKSAVNREHVEAFNRLFQQAQSGTLPFEAMSSVLGSLIDGGNLPVAEMLYTTWRENYHGELKVSKEVHDRARSSWNILRGHFPSIRELPGHVEWLQFNLNGRQVDYRDIDDKYFISIIEKVQKHTITMLEGPEPPWAMYKAIEYIVRNNIPGDLVECGVWNGGSVLLMAQALKHFGDTSRRIYLYDTFEGMPEPADVDRNWDGVPALPTWEAKKKSDPSGPNWGFGGTVDMVKEVVYSSGYPQENFIFVKGMVEDTLPSQSPEKISLLRLDTDFYASTYHELVHLYPVLTVGGVLIIDDYGYFQGARIATDQYLTEQKLPLYLSRITQSVRVAIKPLVTSGGDIKPA